MFLFFLLFISLILNQENYLRFESIFLNIVKVESKTDYRGFFIEPFHLTAQNNEDIIGS